MQEWLSTEDREARIERLTAANPQRAEQMSECIFEWAYPTADEPREILDHFIFVMQRYLDGDPMDLEGVKAAYAARTQSGS